MDVPNILTDYPAPQGVTCETPQEIEIPSSPACGVVTTAPRNIVSSIDKGHFPICLQTSTKLEADLENKIWELLASDDEDGILDTLQGLACDSKNHELLQNVMPRIIKRCDNSQQTLNNFAIQLRCILAEILVEGTQYEPAKSIIRGSGRFLEHQLDFRSLLESSKFELVRTIELARRVALIFVTTKDLEMCERVLEKVETGFNVGPLAADDFYTLLVDFLILMVYDIQKMCEWKRSKLWIGRALLVSYYAFGTTCTTSRQIERMYEADKAKLLLLTRLSWGAFYDEAQCCW
ncbi:hypothetical protein V8C37DRAFT_398152 [Trichoderma ceciliae]